MSNVAKLKKQAAEFEQKRQFDKALAVYVKLLDSFDQHADELDVALFNRVGDLMLRQGNTADAVDYYEKAVDKYADTGFFNNAIALCNKILRHSPGRASIYYKLGKISAQKGFKGEAKVNFLEYADRMQKAGKTHEAFRALKEFADLVPDQDEIRLTLADQLTRADRKEEAVEQLQILHARYDAAGRNLDADAIADRIRALDPRAEIKSEGLRAAKASGTELVFLDLDAPSPRTNPSGVPVVKAAPPVRQPTPLAPLPAPPTPSRLTPLGDTPIGLTPISGLPLVDTTPSSNTPISLTPLGATPIGSTTTGNTPATTRTPLGSTPLGSTPIGSTPIGSTPIGSTPVSTPAQDAGFGDADEREAQFTRADVAIEGVPPEALESPLSGITRVGENMPTPTDTPTTSLAGLETTNLAEQGAINRTPANSLLDIEPTSLVRHTTPVDRSAAPTHSPARETPYGGSVGGALDFVVPRQTPARTPSVTPIDFDSSDLVPTPVAPRQPSPTPLNRSPLDGLPLMDLDVPREKTPATPIPREVTSLGEIAGSSELELIDLGDGGLDLNIEGLTSDDETPGVPTPSVARRSTMVAAHNVEILQATVAVEPNNARLRRELAEAMFEAGDRAGGIRELESAMASAEHAGDLEFAATIAEEIARLEPDSVKHHQKRVEYAYRTNDRPRLIEAYMDLGDALLRVDQIDKARSIYQRVLDLAPDDLRARAALDTLVVPEPEPEPPPAPRTSMLGRRPTGSMKTIKEPEAPTPPPADSFVNLGDWLRDDDAPKDTRMVVAEQEPSGDEDADFADMLRKFKQGVAENVDPEDYQSHYDLAIAFKEMGLLDEAIAEFQKALGSTTNRLPTFESLGQCFLEKGQPKLAASILGRALNERGTEEQLVGVLYLLGRAAEEQGNAAEALAYYQRVFVQDIQFRDISERMSEVERAVQ
ncbi:MAG TPA: tetratricopeptide repeat protein [Gemmatimonadaceae bacterium]